MAHNTTEHLLADVEALREHLGIDRWLLHGGSWASTLILAYALRHPDRVIGIVLVGVTMTRPKEIDWRYGGLRLLFPVEWERFRAGVSDRDRDGNIVEAYRQHGFPSSSHMFRNLINSLADEYHLVPIHGLHGRGPFRIAAQVACAVSGRPSIGGTTVAMSITGNTSTTGPVN